MNKTHTHIRRIGEHERRRTYDLGTYDLGTYDLGTHGLGTTIWETTTLKLGSTSTYAAV